MTPEDASSSAVEVLLLLRRTADGHTTVDVRSAESPISYGTVELSELPLLLEAVLIDLGSSVERRPPSQRGATGDGPGRARR